jgi:hypothetical protein
VLKKAGMAPPDNLQQAVVKGLTNEDLRKALANGDYARASEIFAKDRASWDEAFEGFQKLGRAIKDDDQGYKSFNDTYRKDNERRDWHGTSPEGILAILEHSGGLRVIGKVAPQHSAKTSEDYADLIVRDLADGKLVIIDQSTGDPQMNEAASKRLMWRVFEHQKASFINPKLGPDQEMVLPPDVIVYVEEAHSLLPKDGEDLKDVWARGAKEGSKYRMGLVYATQESSSIMTNILSNTDNWFVAHLNRGGGGQAGSGLL